MIELPNGHFQLSITSAKLGDSVPANFEEKME
jgi:hypothetical protein